jgi:hypothetical protein
MKNKSIDNKNYKKIQKVKLKLCWFKRRKKKIKILGISKKLICFRRIIKNWKKRMRFLNKNLKTNKNK